MIQLATSVFLAWKQTLKVVVGVQENIALFVFVTTVATGAILRFEGQAAGFLATFDGSPGTEDGSVMFDAATCDQTADCRFRVSVPMGGGGAAADRYVYLFPV